LWGACAGPWAGDVVGAKEPVATAEQAQAALGTRLPSVARAQAILAFFRGGIEESRRQAAPWVELAPAPGHAYELAHALPMLASALQITEPTPAAAIATIDESVRVARTA